MDEDKDSSRGFRVTDRRRFSDEGEAQAAADAPEPAPVEESEAPEAFDVGALPEEPLTFSTFVLSLSTQALLHLGEVQDPMSGRIARDLPAAKHLIDILGILRDKTTNNLEQAEAGLLDAVLYDLRMKYVELVRGASKEEA